MPVVSGAGSASGSATVSGTGVLLLTTSMRSTSLAVVNGIPDYSASTGVAAATGTATVTGAGEAVATSLAIGGYTYDPPAAPPFINLLRRNPDPGISNALGSTMPTGHFRVGGLTAPVGGQDVQLDFSDGFGLLLGGTIQSTTLVFEGLPTHIAWDVLVVQYLWRLGARCPFGCWTDISATTVVEALIGQFALGFSTSHVQAALPNVTVSFDGSKNLIDCLSEIATQIGQCYFRVDNSKDVYFFQTDSSDLPDPLTDGNRTLLFDSQIEYTLDDSQIRNRVCVRGVTTTLEADALPGANRIEVTSITYFQQAGMLTSGCQRFFHTGSETTSTVPTRSDPTNLLRAQQAIDPISGMVLSGLIHLAVQYAYSLVRTDGTESALSPITKPDEFLPWNVPLYSGGSPTPTTGGALPTGVALQWAISAYTDDGSTGILFIGSLTLTGPNNAADIPIPAIPDDRVLGVQLWRTLSTDSTLYYFIADIPGNVASTYTDVTPEVSLLELAPVGAYGTQTFYNHTGVQVDVDFRNLSAPSGSTIKLYRSVGDIYGLNYGPFRLLTSVAAGTEFYRDNTETLTYDQFKFNADQAIPPTVPGTPPPDDPPPVVRAFLTGVSGITETIPKGTEIALFIELNSISSQSAYAARTGGDGIREMPMISNASLKSYAAMTTRGQAELTIFGSPIETLRYSTLDTKSVVGKKISVSLTHPPIVTELIIQTVELDLIRYQPGKPPRYAVTAASVKFTLNDFMRTALLSGQ